MTKSINLDRPFILSTLLAVVLILATWAGAADFAGLQDDPEQIWQTRELQTRYVLKSGTDERNDCLMSENPCATISHAVHVASASDPIVVDTDTYRESLRLDNYLPLVSADENHLRDKIYVHDINNVQNVQFLKNLMYFTTFGSLLILSFIEIRRRISSLQHGDILYQQAAVAQTVPETGKPSVEKAFIKKMNSLLEKHISDERFNVEMLALEMNMSSRNLRRKTRVILGESPVAILRRFRLERAREMLSRNTDNVSQIAYQCGFSDPGYFSRCFRLEYGTQPSQYKAA
jgi:AraC-like DNA-binding protein